MSPEDKACYRAVARYDQKLKRWLKESRDLQRAWRRIEDKFGKDTVERASVRNLRLNG